jgi:hypothetical protein
VMFKRLIKSRGQRSIRDICGRRERTMGNKNKVVISKVPQLSGRLRNLPSCVGPIPPLVITKSYFWIMRLLASTLCMPDVSSLLFSGGEGTELGRTFHVLHLESPRFASCHDCHAPVPPETESKNAGYYVQIDTIFKAVAREIIRVAFKRLAVQNLVSCVKNKNKKEEFIN